MVALAEVDLAQRSPTSGPDDLEQIFAMSCQLEDPCWEGASGRVLALHHARAGRTEEAIGWTLRERSSTCCWSRDW